MHKACQTRIQPAVSNPQALCTGYPGTFMHDLRRFPRTGVSVPEYSGETQAYVCTWVAKPEYFWVMKWVCILVPACCFCIWAHLVVLNIRVRRYHYVAVWHHIVLWTRTNNFKYFEKFPPNPARPPSPASLPHAIGLWRIIRCANHSSCCSE